VQETLFQELKRYVQWGPEDEAALRALKPVIAPFFKQIAEVFYDRILSHESARKALQGGESQVGHLKVALVAWMDRLLSGPWDEDYYELRARIGRMHVRIALPQHYMMGAMNVLRHEFNDVIYRHYRDHPDALRQATMAKGKILDLELAIMLHTYREDLLSQQARVERLATFGQLVGSIGHELRNPLGVIESSLFILKGRIGQDERAHKHAQRIAEQVALANDIVSKLLDMIRDRPLAKEPVDVPKLLQEAASSLVWPAGVRFALEADKGLPSVPADAVQLRQVFVNLLENGLHAASPEGEVTARARQQDECVEVVVQDTGPGVDASIGARLFEPLVTTKAKGIGLGLALVKRIVERHGGTISHQPVNPHGARFSVRLPVAQRKV
jgi:two-component system sensor histidine kinase HydH